MGDRLSAGLFHARPQPPQPHLQREKPKIGRSFSMASLVFFYITEAQGN